MAEPIAAIRPSRTSKRVGSPAVLLSTSTIRAPSISSSGAWSGRGAAARGQASATAKASSDSANSAPIVLIRRSDQRRTMDQCLRVNSRIASSRPARVSGYMRSLISCLISFTDWV